MQKWFLRAFLLSYFICTFSRFLKISQKKHTEKKKINLKCTNWKCSAVVYLIIKQKTHKHSAQTQHTDKGRTLAAERGSQCGKINRLRRITVTATGDGGGRRWRQQSCWLRLRLLSFGCATCAWKCCCGSKLNELPNWKPFEAGRIYMTTSNARTRREKERESVGVMEVRQTEESKANRE